MALLLRCGQPQCGATLQIPDNAVGKKVRCPKCGHVQVAEEPPLEVLSVLPVPTPPKAQQEPVVLEEVFEDDAVADVSRRERPRATDESRPAPSRGARLYCPVCDTRAESDDDSCVECGFPLTELDLREELDKLTRQRGLYQTLSLVLGVPGLSLAVASSFVDDLLVKLMLLILGVLLLWVGIGFGVLHKRYNLAWVLLGLLWIIGLIVLACLPDEKGQRLLRIKEFLYDRYPQARRKPRRQRDE